MRVAFDATAMPRQRAGAGVYMYQLGRALAARTRTTPLLLLDRHGAFDDLAGGEGLTLRRVRADGRARRFLWEQTAMPWLVRRWHADVFHGPHHALPLLPAATAAVTTIHDITFDLIPRRYTRGRRLYMRVITRLGLLRADRVIVPSAFVRDALIRRYRVSATRIDVVPEAAAPEMARVTDPIVLREVRQAYALPERFVLSVGTLEPGKNRETLVRAVAEARRRGVPHALVVVGGAGWLAGPSQPDDGVIFTGYVPDAHLAALYSLAEIFVFPSLLEGFGLPPLEAMACGAPVIASNRPAMPEVLGDAALYADPRQPAAWADAIERLATDATLRRSLAERGLVRAAAYSWDRAAQQTIAVYEAALRRHRAAPLS